MRCCEYGTIGALLTNILLAGHKHASLFSVTDEENRFITLLPVVNVIKLFSLSLMLWGKG
jgi:hypothetical protein